MLDSDPDQLCLLEQTGAKEKIIACCAGSRHPLLSQNSPGAGCWGLPATPGTRVPPGTCWDPGGEGTGSSWTELARWGSNTPGRNRCARGPGRWGLLKFAKTSFAVKGQFWGCVGGGSNRGGVWGWGRAREQQGSEVLGVGPPQIPNPPPNPCLCLRGCAGLQGRAGRAPWGWAHSQGQPPSTPPALSSLKPLPRTPSAGDAHWPPSPIPQVRVVGSSPHPRWEPMAGRRGMQERWVQSLGGRSGPLPPPQGLHRLLNSSFFLLQSIWGARLLLRFWCARSLATASGMSRSRMEPDAEWRLSPSCVLGWGARVCISSTMPPGRGSAQTPLSSHRLPPVPPALPRCGCWWSQGTQPVARDWTGSRTLSWTAALHCFPWGGSKE